MNLGVVGQIVYRWTPEESNELQSLSRIVGPIGMVDIDYCINYGPSAVFTLVPCPLGLPEMFKPVVVGIMVKTGPTAPPGCSRLMACRTLHGVC